MSWIEWVVNYVNENLPDPPGDGAIRTAEGEMPGHFIELEAGQFAVCDICDECCQIICGSCGAGVHSVNHATRHAARVCDGEENYPDWLFYV